MSAHSLQCHMISCVMFGYIYVYILVLLHVTTNRFMAPEVLGMWDRNFKGYDKGYTKSADYYSLGMTMIVLLKGQNPFSSDNFHHFLRFLHDEPPMVYKHCLDNLKASLDGPTYEIISQFISLEAMSRLGSGRCVQYCVCV